MQNYSRIAGILTIVSGAFGILYLIGAIFFIFFFRFMMRSQFYYGSSVPSPDDFFKLMAVFYAVFGVCYALVGIFGVICGTFALKKQKWGLALAGAISGAVVFFPVGIPAIIYVSLAKPEFAANTAPANITPPTAV